MKDLARIYTKAGGGGDGSVHFRREKYIPKGGPDGGDGGKGGDVVLVADENITSLVEFNYQKKFEAKNGDRGSEKRSSGRDAKDIVVRVPRGTQVYEIPALYMEKNLRNREQLKDLLSKRRLLVDMTEHNQEYVVAYGGKGGKGNDHFKSSTNQTPMEAEEGGKGEEKYLLLELKVVADVGIMGLPNVGKSSLLKALTAANPKIAGYPFTTLEPNLGVLQVGKSKIQNNKLQTNSKNVNNNEQNRKQHIVLVDIPGVIEEAWEGKGIGPWFLKHLERTSQLIHVLAPDYSKFQIQNDKLQTNPKLEIQNIKQITEQLVRDYKIVREELAKFGQGLSDKPEIVVVNKMELIQDSKEREKVGEELGKKIDKKVLWVSAGMKEGLEELVGELS